MNIDADYLSVTILFFSSFRFASNLRHLRVHSVCVSMCLCQLLGALLSTHNPPISPNIIM